ncbi:hypothetical protein FZC66_09530 [Priestia megaterium]|nr:hypothetical protein FZC66_09530 [Priestia megaterium]
MTSFLGIGFVYKQNSVDEIKAALEKLLSYMAITETIYITYYKKGSKHQLVKYATTYDFILDSTYIDLANGHDVQLFFFADLGDSIDREVEVEIVKKDGGFALFLKVNVEEEGENNLMQLERYVPFMKNFYVFFPYHYCVCDEGIESEYLFSEIEQVGDDVYAITITPIRNGLSPFLHVNKKAAVSTEYH